MSTATNGGDVQHIPLDKIKPLKGVQPRDKLDQHHIESLVATGPDSWPPITVAQVDGWYGIIDGHHRVQAALRIQDDQEAENDQRAKAKPAQPPKPVLSAIAARVRTAGTTQEARIMAIEGNIQNGLPVPYKARLELAERLKETVPGISNREIARRAGITEGTVRNMIARAKATKGDTAEERYSVAAQVPAARKLIKLARDFVNENRAGGFLGIGSSATHADAPKKRVAALVQEAKATGETAEVVAAFTVLSAALTEAIKQLTPNQKATSDQRRA